MSESPEFSPEGATIIERSDDIRMFVRVLREVVGSRFHGRFIDEIVRAILAQFDLYCVQVSLHAGKIMSPYSVQIGDGHVIVWCYSEDPYGFNSGDAFKLIFTVRFSGQISVDFETVYCGHVHSQKH